MNVSVGGGNPIENLSGLILIEALPSGIRDKVLLQIGKNDLRYSTVLTTTKKIWPHRSEVAAFTGLASELPSEW